MFSFCQANDFIGMQTNGLCIKLIYMYVYNWKCRTVLGILKFIVKVSTIVLHFLCEDYKSLLTSYYNGQSFKNEKEKFYTFLSFLMKHIIYKKKKKKLCKIPSLLSYYEHFENIIVDLSYVYNNVRHPSSATK